MNKEAVAIQKKCKKCLLSIDKEESYAVFVTEDWKIPFMEYLAQGILPTDKTLAHQLKKLVVRYFLQDEDLVQKGVQRGSLKMPRVKGRQRSSQGSPYQ